MNLATAVRTARRRDAAVLTRCREYLAGGDRGAVSLIFAVSASVMLGALSMTIDLGRYAISQARMQSALDVANLTASMDMGHYASTTCPTSLTAWQKDALAYYNTNMPNGYLDILLSSNNFNATCTNNPGGGQYVQLSAAGELPLMMPAFLGSKGSSTSTGSTGGNDMQVAASNQVARNPQTQLELALVLDNTGSMAQTLSGSSASKIVGLQNAANNLLGQLFAQSGSAQYYIGIVPFASTVNVGMTPSWLDGNNATVSASLSAGTGTWLKQSFSYNSSGVSMSGTPKVSLSGTSWAWTGSGWGGCVVEPHDSSGNLAALAYSPSSATATPTSPYLQFTPYYYNVPSAGLTLYTQTGSGKKATCTTKTVSQFPTTIGSGKNGTCTTTSSTLPISQWDLDQPSTATYTLNQNNLCIGTPVTFLTNDQTQLGHAISAMQPAGNTIIPLGLLWGWRMLSSSWAGTWIQRSTITTPLPIPESSMGLQRVLILMTDGQNDVSSSSIPGQEVTYFNGLSGVGTNNLHAPSVSSTLASGSIVLNDINTYQAAVCTAIKNAGITIYTIAFGAGAAGTSLQSCASPGDYYVASNNSSLNTVFQQIASQIAVLRLTQ
ncbi:VWA domain-containing protein [Paraburkholderia monticola]|uniref:VWA domain-containing protein n=1 Tax=Paraburkholderia monticola TaxID=1399968 RepID=UPI000A7CD1B0|nr:VWA domain-containing protein [Paraburkholderia monticola]